MTINKFDEQSITNTMSQNSSFILIFLDKFLFFEKDQ